MTKKIALILQKMHLFQLLKQK